MRVVQINAVAYGSTGRIMFQLADSLASGGDDVLCTAGFTWKKCNREDFFLTSNIFEKTIHTYLARLTGRIGCFSHFATARLLKRLDMFSPDVIHLHNVHGWFVNLPMLFGYIKRKKIPVVWTFHDCWPMTGHCPHFDMIGCDKWKSGCHHCALYREYPQCWFDRSDLMYGLKKKWFTGVENLTVVTPSCWLKGIVKESFLGCYPVRVINNGIDLTIFRPQPGAFREQYNCEDKKLVLGVAYAWDEKKGLDVFLELAERLGDDYRIVLVGTDENVEKHFSENIISIRRTQNQCELAEIYTASDVFVNPTREDNYPTVNMEALACGTPVITFETGGSPEILCDTCGCVVRRDDIDELERQIRRVCVDRPFSTEMCLKHASCFAQEYAVGKYLDLYRSIK